MKPEERIKICKKCSNYGFDIKSGIICNLTNKKPTFENECPDFKMVERKETEMPNTERKKTMLEFLSKEEKKFITDKAMDVSYGHMSQEVFHSLMKEKFPDLNEKEINKAIKRMRLETKLVWFVLAVIFIFLLGVTKKIGLW